MIDFQEMQLTEDIHSKLDEFEVDFAFQPIYRLEDMYLVGYEALMRPKDKVVGFINVFHEMNVLVLAECVETEEELNYLKSVGVDFAQGYYLGKPA